MDLRKIVIDSCTIKYAIQKHIYHFFYNCYILPFQLKELSTNQIFIFFDKKGKLLKIKSTLHGDNNFLRLDPKKYIILTHDKTLKRKLKQLHFYTHSNIYSCS